VSAAATRRVRFAGVCPPTVFVAVTASGIGVAALAHSQSYDPAAVTQQICQGYAAAQHALPYATMYAQCMYARGYLVPGFSPSPDSPGYQGEMPGPGAIGGGH
jgi:hypothetical protein